MATPVIFAFRSVFTGTLISDYFDQGARSALSFGSAAVRAYNDVQAAQLGLQSIAAFKGIDQQAATAAVNGLKLVQDGLLTTGEASAALKNLLSSGFSLDQSIELLKRFGDSAAFGRQSALGFGQAIVSATEGVKNQNSILVDNAGVTKNLSVILKERGFQLQDLSDKVKGAAAREALYQGLLSETQGQLGDAAKLSQAFAGGLSRLDAAQQKLLASIGEQIAKSPDFNKGLEEMIGQIVRLTEEIGTDGTGANRAMKDFMTLVGESVQMFNNLVISARAALSAYEEFKRFSLHDEAITVVGAALGVQARRQSEAILENEMQLTASWTKFMQTAHNVNQIDEEAARAAEAQLEKTRQRVAEIAAEARKVDAIIADMESKNDAFLRARLDHEKRVKEFKDKNSVSPEQETRFTRASEAQMRQELQKLERQALDQVQSLRDQLLANDPFTSLFDQAGRRWSSFIEQNKGASAATVAQFKQLNDELKQLELFKAGFGAASRINELAGGLARLQAGLAGESLRDADRRHEEEKQALRRQIEDLQGPGGDGQKHLELLAKINELDRKRDREQLEQSIVARQVETAQAFLAQAQTDRQREFALDTVLSATADISRLTPEQADIRVRALEQRLAIEMSLLERQEKRDQKMEKLVEKVEAVVGVLAGASETLAAAATEPPAQIEIVDRTDGAVEIERLLGTVTSRRGTSFREF